MAFTEVPITDVRNYWDRRPCNVRHGDVDAPRSEYWRQVEERKYFIEPHIPGFAQFERWKGRDVLEIGCGIGTDTVHFARAGARVVATDLSPRSIDLAKDHYARDLSGDDFHAAQFLVADAENMRRYFLPTRKFDLIYSFGVIHHSPHPGNILIEARHLVRPAGELRIMVYHRYSTKVLALLLRHPVVALRHGIDHAVAIQSEAQTGSPITYTYTRRSARRLLEATRWQVTEMRVDHIFPYAIGPYREHRHVKRWYWRWMPRPLFRFLERRIGWHLLITARPA